MMLSVASAHASAPVPSSEPPCAVAEAAVRGSQAGYDRQVDAASRVADMNREVSEIVGNCVGGISSIITMPSLSIGGLFDAIIDRVCRAVNTEINGVVGSFDSYVDDTLDVPELNVGVDVRRNNGGIGSELNTRELDTPSPLDWF